MNRAGDDALTRETGREPLAVPTRQQQSAVLAPGAADAAGFERLRALVQRGYVADAERAGPGGGLLLNHRTGPALLLMPDGTVESLERRGAVGLGPDRIGAESRADQRLFENFLERLAPGRRTSRWRKRFVVTFLILAIWMMSIALTIIFGNM